MMEPENKDQPQSPSTVGDDIFVLKPEPKEPVNKKSIWLTVGLTSLGILVLIAVLVGAVVASAGSIAENYNGIALQQLKKLNKPLVDLEPSIVLNNRNITDALEDVYVSKQAQPSLASTLFFDELNPQYVKAKKTQIAVKKYYSQLDLYNVQLKQLIEFDDSVHTIMVKEAGMEARAVANDPLSIRSVSGSFQDLSDEIKDLSAPAQLKDVQKQLADTYKSRAAIYKKWALSIEGGDTSTTEVTQKQLLDQKNKAIGLATDKKYIKLFAPSYEELLTNQKNLQAALSN